MKPHELPNQDRIKSISLFDNGEVESVEYYEIKRLLPGRPAVPDNVTPHQIDL